MRQVGDVVDPDCAYFSGDDKSQMTDGKWDDEAEVLYWRALAITENNLGPDHSDVATIYHNLGGLEHARGRYSQGEPFARRSVEIREGAETRAVDALKLSYLLP